MPTPGAFWVATASRVSGKVRERKAPRLNEGATSTGWEREKRIETRSNCPFKPAIIRPARRASRADGSLGTNREPAI
jgi:hypothetical protein